ncbi:MAG TPA: PaaI family thioesterase [Dehalococcoidia bacterium]|nr:PaaI family thioesterase [Dehalococcoidia bacterium]
MQIPQPKIGDATGSLCFACGKDNPIGLKLQFTDDGGIVKGEFTPGKFHQGWPGITHGGILCTLLDEAAGYAVIYAGLNCITVKSEVRFANLAPIDEPIQVSAQITKKTSRLVETEATLSLKDSTIIAKSSSLWYVVRRSKATD